MIKAQAISAIETPIIQETPYNVSAVILVTCMLILATVMRVERRSITASGSRP